MSTKFNSIRFMNHAYTHKAKEEEDDDDDLLLADLKSLKITEEKMWHDMYHQQQNEIYQQQIQASYYQLQYLQQQQMMSMMRQSTSSRRSSTASSISSHHRPSLSQSSSNTSVKQARRPHRISTDHEPIKRRQSLGKRIKKVFGMTEEQVSPLIENKTTELPKEKKEVYLGPKGDRPYLDHLPSPASSTVSTNTTSTSSSKKSLSFNPVIQLHETFSSSEYDRRCDKGTTCQKLTPTLAIKIKEELNQFKLNDMSVHIDSRQYTHFFI